MRKISYLIALGMLLFGAGCSDRSEKTAQSDEPVPIVVQLDWVPEPQHGGLYMAKALGLFENEGLDVKLVPGGPNANVRLRVATNRAQFGQVEGNNAILAIKEGLPIKLIAALFQHDPSTFLMHTSNPINSFEEFDGKRLKARPQWAFLDYLREVKNIEFSITPVDFGLEVFAADPKTIQQGYYIAEPYYLNKLGIEVKWLHVWDAGYDGISGIAGNVDFMNENPAATQAFLRAYYMGQLAYYEGDPTPAHELILKANDQATMEFLNWSRDKIKEEQLAKGDPEKGGAGDYLLLTKERIEKQIKQLERIGVLKESELSVDSVFEGQFLPTAAPPLDSFD